MSIFTIQIMNEAKSGLSTRAIEEQNIGLINKLLDDYKNQNDIIENIEPDQPFDKRNEFWTYGTEIKNNILNINNNLIEHGNNQYTNTIRDDLLQVQRNYLAYENRIFKIFSHLEGDPETLNQELTRSQELFQSTHSSIMKVKNSLSTNSGNSLEYFEGIFNEFLFWQVFFMVLIGILIMLTALFLNRINKNLESEIQNKTKALQKANNKLQQLDKKRSQFIAIASHELKGPLQPVLGFVDLAKAGIITSREALDGISGLILHLENVANNVLDLTKIEDSNLKLNLERCKINTVIKEAAEDQKFNPNRSVPIKKNLDTDISINLDKTRTKQVLRNILDNCIKFTKKGEISIQTNIIQEKNVLKIIISDTGVKIPENILPKIFNRNTTSDEEPGFGLGLYIAKKIIDAHNGSITAYNKMEKPVFEITLPLMKTNQEIEIIN